MNPFDNITKQKYKAFVQEFERTRPNLFQNIKPQLGLNKSYDLVSKESSGSPHRRDVYAQQMNDSIKPLISASNYPPEKTRTPTKGSSNLSSAVCFPKSPTALKDLNYVHCKAMHHNNCRPNDNKLQVSNRDNRSYSRGSITNTSMNNSINHGNNSYARIFNEDRGSKHSLDQFQNENYILSLINKENLQKNSYAQKFQMRKNQINKTHEAASNWDKDRKTDLSPKSKQYTPPKKEWVGTRNFKNSKYYGRNDFYPLHSNNLNNSKNMTRNSSKASYFEYEETEDASGKFLKNSGKKSPQKQKETSPQKYLPNKHKISASSPNLRETRNERSHKYINAADYKLPENLNQQTIVKIQKAWRKALKNKQIRRVNAQSFDEERYYTGKFVLEPSALPNSPKNEPNFSKQHKFEEQSYKNTNHLPELKLIVEQLSHELRTANKNIAHLKHENGTLKNDIDTLEKDIQAKMEDKIAVEKLNNSELVNQYVSVVETLLEEKKDISQKTEELMRQMQQAEEVIRLQGEVIVAKKNEAEMKNGVDKENQHLKALVDKLKREADAAKEATEVQQGGNNGELKKLRQIILEYENKFFQMEAKIQSYERKIKELEAQKAQSNGPNGLLLPPAKLTSELKLKRDDNNINLMSLSEENNQLKKEISSLKLYTQESSKAIKPISDRYQSPIEPNSLEKLATSEQSTPEKPNKNVSAKSGNMKVESPDRNKYVVTVSAILPKETEKPLTNDVQNKQHFLTNPSKPKDNSSISKGFMSENNKIIIPSLNSGSEESDFKENTDYSKKTIAPSLVPGLEKTGVHTEAKKDVLKPPNLMMLLEKERQKHEVSFSDNQDNAFQPQSLAAQDEMIQTIKLVEYEVTKTEITELSFKQANPTDYISFGSPGPDEQIQSNVLQEQSKFTQEAERDEEFNESMNRDSDRLRNGVDLDYEQQKYNQNLESDAQKFLNESSSFREEDFDHMEAMQEELMNKFGNILSKMDEENLLQHFDENTSSL